MKDGLKTLLVGAIIGSIATAVIIGSATRSEIERLKTTADSIKVAAVTRDSAATARASQDSLLVDSLQKSKAPVIVRISQDSALADSADRAIARAETAADSNKAYVVQVAALKSENAGLRQNARTDSLSLWVAMRRGDSLQVALHDQTQAIVSLNAQIQRLNAHTFPKWLRVSFAIVEKGLAVKGAVDLIQGR